MNSAASHGNGTRGGLGDAADHNAPSAAAQVLQHEEGETSECKAEIEEIGKQIGAEELVGL